MNKEQIIRMAKEAGGYPTAATDRALLLFSESHLERFAILVAEQQREEDAKLVESMTLEWPDQPEFAKVERATIQDCALIIRQRAVTYD